MIFGNAAEADPTTSVALTTAAMLSKHRLTAGVWEADETEAQGFFAQRVDRCENRSAQAVRLSCDITTNLWWDRGGAGIGGIGPSMT
ncbi:hypothetical protein RBSWK_00095 [Rhodopirellula baltica SWK14]|uniref:Uncharacterized protein n=1 Tax=Rhodopirellula baltica SWK14 TaxID=993516 RepID=L7CSK2_RHOBT|nr:hypothetical protein RBSWK_00095 [Rhodopirellula baltica SWK14]